MYLPPDGMTFSTHLSMIPLISLLSPLPGDLSGRFLRSGVPDPPVVGRLQVQIHRRRRQAQVHQKAHLHHRWVSHSQALSSSALIKVNCKLYDKGKKKLILQFILGGNPTFRQSLPRVLYELFFPLAPHLAAFHW